MPQPQIEPNNSADTARLPWLPPGQLAVNDDYSVRAEVPSHSANWIPIGVPGVLINVLEFNPSRARFTAVLKLAGYIEHAQLCWHESLELFVVEGLLSWNTHRFPQGSYLRMPSSSQPHTDTQGSSDQNANLPQLQLSLVPREVVPTANPNFDCGAELFVSGGQINDNDSEERRIDTHEDDRWLPGPVDGTEVLPLHVHGASNAMLVRWLAPVSFHPKLDPQGEEIYVLRGHLRDINGTYPKGSWIRNPIPSWQAWAGEPDTVIFYKSGHFIDCV